MDWILTITLIRGLTTFLQFGAQCNVQQQSNSTNRAKYTR